MAFQILKFYKKLIKENLIWLKRISAWAGIWVAIGVSTSIFYPQLFFKIRDFLDEVLKDVLGEKELVLNFSTAVLIFKNNFLAAVLSLSLGIIFGLVPLFAVAVNFFILGFLFGFLAIFSPLKTELPGVAVFLLSILPHGIIEIPTFLLASAFGVKMGFSIREWKLTLKQIFQILPLLTVMFFLAALVEIFITGNLIEKLVLR